jgi:hypothetical protein
MLYNILKRIGLIKPIECNAIFTTNIERIIPISKILKDVDYTRGGIGIYNDHYMKIYRLRREKKEYQEEWDKRDGYSICGRKLNKRHHPLHDIELKNKKTGKIYEIDAVYKQHHRGYYISLAIREKGTKSHGIRFWENINCHDTLILNSIKENKNDYITINKKENISSG